MTRSYHLGAWLAGSIVGAFFWPSVRHWLSPWSAIDASQIVMFSSDACGTSRKALELVAADDRLEDLIVPVPADGPDEYSPTTCAAALHTLAKKSGWVRLLPERLACYWLAADAYAVEPQGGVPTPSWFTLAGGFTGPFGSDSEAELFRKRGWRIQWSAGGVGLTRIDEAHPELATIPDEAYRRVEDLGVSAYRDERW